MTFFSRCDASQGFEPTLKAAAPRRARTAVGGRGLREVLSDLAEDLVILVLYAAGRDYYGRDRVRTGN